MMFAATTMLAIALQATIQTAPPPPRVYAPPAPPLPSPIITGPVRLQKDVPLIGEDDYPQQAQFDDQSGATTFVLTVGTKGRASACDVVTGSGFPQLDVTACTLVRQRARFAPATQGGKPVESKWRSRVVWQLPDSSYLMVDPRAAGNARTPPEARDDFFAREPRRIAQRAYASGARSGSSYALIDIDTVGSVMRCTLDGGDADGAFASLACPLLLGQKLFTPAFDRDGNAVPDRVRVKIRW
jgi:TonB family protein